MPDYPGERRCRCCLHYEQGVFGRDDQPSGQCHYLPIKLPKWPKDYCSKFTPAHARPEGDR